MLKNRNVSVLKVTAVANFLWKRRNMIGQNIAQCDVNIISIRKRANEMTPCMTPRPPKVNVILGEWKTLSQYRSIVAIAITM